MYSIESLIEIAIVVVLAVTVIGGIYATFDFVKQYRNRDR